MMAERRLWEEEEEEEEEQVEWGRELMLPRLNIWSQKKEKAFYRLLWFVSINK